MKKLFSTLLIMTLSLSFTMAASVTTDASEKWHPPKIEKTTITCDQIMSQTNIFENIERNTVISLPVGNYPLVPVGTDPVEKTDYAIIGKTIDPNLYFTFQRSKGFYYSTSIPVFHTFESRVFVRIRYLS